MRKWWAAFGCCLLAVFAAAQEPTPDKFLGIETVRLWQGRAPGAIADTAEDIPTLSILVPVDNVPNHPAVIVAPGGAYKVLAGIHEGREAADWFAARGFTAFVLRYRLGPRYLYPTPLKDAQRAVRYVRSHAQQYNIDPNRIGMIGFSAGGHLTAMTATTADEGDPGATDPIDHASSGLNFMVLGYPWLNAMEAQQDNWLSYCGAMDITDAAKCRSFEQYSPLRGVNAKTPPAFIFHTADDQTVPIRASIEFFNALHAAGIPAELHVFAHGPHGVGFGGTNQNLEAWPLLLEHWLRSLKLL